MVDNDLKIGDWVIFKRNANEIGEYGEVVYFTVPTENECLKVIVERTDKVKLEIPETLPMEKISHDTARELKQYKNTMEEKQKMQQYNTGGLTTSQKANKIPTHYQGMSDIDLIEFFYQQWGLAALRAVVSFNIQRYALRLGRKDEETKELGKIIDYAERFIEKKENEND